MTDTMRTHPKELTASEKLAVQAVKEGATTFLAVLKDYCAPGRETSLAMTRLEEAVMWAVKGITK